MTVEVRGQFAGPVLSFHQVDPNHWAQVVRLGSEHPMEPLIDLWLNLRIKQTYSPLQYINTKIYKPKASHSTQRKPSLGFKADSWQFSHPSTCTLPSNQEPFGRALQNWLPLTWCGVLAQTLSSEVHPTLLNLPLFCGLPFHTPSLSCSAGKETTSCLHGSPRYLLFYKSAGEIMDTQRLLAELDWVYEWTGRQRMTLSKAQGRAFAGTKQKMRVEISTVQTVSAVIRILTCLWLYTQFTRCCWIRESKKAKHYKGFENSHALKSSPFSSVPQALSHICVIINSY